MYRFEALIRLFSSRFRLEFKKISQRQLFIISSRTITFGTFFQQHQKRHIGFKNRSQYTPHTQTQKKRKWQNTKKLKKINYKISYTQIDRIFSRNHWYFCISRKSHFWTFSFLCYFLFFPTEHHTSMNTGELIRFIRQQNQEISF